MDPAVIRDKMDEVTKNADNVSRFFKDVNIENMRLVRPSYEAYMNKASKLHEEFGELVKEHVSKVLGCDESCLEDCFDQEFVSFYELPKCLKHCKCKEGLITIEREGGSNILGGLHKKRGGIMSGERLFELEGEEEDEGFLDFMRHKNPFKKGTSYFSNIEEEEEGTEDVELFGKIGEDYKDIIHKKRDIKHPLKHKGILGRERDESGYDWPELMRYSDYDKKAWNFFKKYEEDV